MQSDRLEVVLRTGGRQVRKDAAGGDLADGEWSGGEALVVPLETDEVCGDADELEVRLVYESTSNREYVVGSKTVAIEREGFRLQDGTVIPEADYTADVELLGTGFTYGAGGPRIPVTVDVLVDGTTYEPWPGNVNDGGNPRSHTLSNQPANAGISVTVTGDPDGEYVGSRTRASTDTEDGWVYVLRDGDTPPNLEGFGDQDDAAAYVQPYLEDGTLDLASNEAIFLFELGDSRSGAAADYQDAVVLVTLRTEAEETGESSPDEYVVVCPETD